MSTKTGTPKASPDTDRFSGRGSASTGVVTFFVGAAIVAYLFVTNPDSKSFEAYNFINTGLCFWVPLMTILFVLRQEPTQFGLTRGDRKLGLKWALIAWAAMLLPVVYFAHRGDVQDYYLNGRLRNWSLTGFGFTTVFDGVHANLKALLYYELAMGFYMFCWEFFFRGFLLFGLQKSRVGTWGAVIIQALLFMLLHWAWKDHTHASKPSLEVWSALPGGLILGILAIRTRSCIYGFLAHWAISMTLDLFLLVPFIFRHFG